PLKRPDIYELVEHASRSGLHVSLTPSATPLVTDDAVRRMRDVGLNRLAISIDGADARTHDTHRGVPGSWTRSLRILAAGRGAALPRQVEPTLAPATASQIDAMAELLAGQGSAMWSVFFLVPVGRAVDGARLSADECERAFEQLWWHAQRQPYAIKTTEAPHYRRFVVQAQRGHKQFSPQART